jgi:hypothetical protein
MSQELKSSTIQSDISKQTAKFCSTCVSKNETRKEMFAWMLDQSGWRGWCGGSHLGGWDGSSGGSCQGWCRDRSRCGGGQGWTMNNECSKPVFEKSSQSVSAASQWVNKIIYDKNCPWQGIPGHSRYPIMSDTSTCTLMVQGENLAKSDGGMWKKLHPFLLS